MIRLLLICLVLAIMIAGCAPPPLGDGESTPPVTIDDPSLRPDIPHDPTDTERPQYENPGEQPQGQPGNVFLNNTFSKRSISFNIPLTETLGEHFPIITVREFPLLRHPAILVEQGLAESYKEEIVFDHDENTTGRIIFTKDDDSIGTFLFFEEDKPIFTYRLWLERDLFENIQGREVQILGHTYVIAEASNTSVTLFGLDVDSNLLFQNGSRLRVNSSVHPDTEVTVDTDYLEFTLYANDPDDGGILLSPGEALSENTGQEKLASELLDIRYDGAPMLGASRISLDRRTHGYRLSFTTVDGRELNLDLVESDAGKIILGSLDNPLRIDRCRTHCIQPEDMMLLKTRDDMMFVMRYSSTNNESNILYTRMDGDRFGYELNGQFNRSNVWTDIILADWAFRADIGPYWDQTDNYNISVQQGFTSDRVEIVTLGEFIIRIGDIIDDKTLPLEIVVPRHLTEDRREELTPVNLTFESGEWYLKVGGNFTMVEEEDTEDEYGVTKYGTSFWLDKDDEDFDSREAAELEILLPLDTVWGTVSLIG